MYIFYTSKGGGFLPDLKHAKSVTKNIDKAYSKRTRQEARDFLRVFAKGLGGPHDVRIVKVSHSDPTTGRRFYRMDLA
jgi:hypothetical protein